MSVYPKALIQYLVHFHSDRDFFECHEVLEDYWKKHLEDPCREVYVGLIQLAVSLYHQRRGNLRGAVKMLESALQHLKEEQLEQLGLDTVGLHKLIRERLQALSNPDFIYSDLNIPITDPALMASCQELCDDKNVLWLKESEMDNPFVIHKHKLRDRSGIIEEREARKQLKNQQTVKRDLV